MNGDHLFNPFCGCMECKQAMDDYEYKMYCQNCGDLRSECECVEGYDD